MNTNADAILKRMEYNSVWSNFMVVFKLSLSGKLGMKFFNQIVVAVIFLLFLIIFSYHFSIREIVSSAIVSGIFGFCMWFGTVFAHKESWNYFLRNKYVKILDAWYILAYALFFFGILLCIGKVAMWSLEKQEENKSVQTHGNKLKKEYKVFFVCMLVLFVCWMPYYISLWPGTLHGDFPMQVLQFFHFPTRLQGQLTSDGMNIFYSNDHPFLRTQITGFFIKLGMQHNNLELGYGMYTFLQMAMYIIGFSLLLTTLFHFHVKQIMITLFLLAAAKNQGFYIVVTFFLISLIWLKKYRIKVAVTMLVPVLFFQFIYVGIIFPACRVNTVGTQEGLSFCFQQTARYIKYHGDEVTEEEKQAIDKILAYEDIAKNYDPNLSDPVKSTYKKDSNSEDLHNYFRVWLSMGLKHPGEYVQAFIANTYAYYSPRFSNTSGIYIKFLSMRDYVNRRKRAREEIPEKFVEENSCKVPEEIKPIREKMSLFCSDTYKMPVFSWFYNPGVITWMLIVAFYAFWIEKRYTDIMTFLPVLLVVGVCLLSPKNNNLRYIYPACCMVPAITVTAFSNFGEWRSVSSRKS